MADNKRVRFRYKPEWVTKGGFTMFAGFNLTGLDNQFLSHYKGAGEVTYNQQKKYVQKKLDRFILDDGSLMGRRCSKIGFQR